MRQAIAARRADFAEKTWRALTEWLQHGEPVEVVGQRHGVSVWTLYSARRRLIRRLKTDLEGLID